jgi:DNA-binding transcriptional ArsR family regulator
MDEGPNIARVAAMIGDTARSQVLTALMDGRAHTATELADAAGVTRQTISFHLGKLHDAGMIELQRQGRHRYFRLAGAEVAELLESLMGLATRAAPIRPVFGPRDPALRKARICYDHLAGELGVLVYDEMHRLGLLCELDGSLGLTAPGRDWCTRLGIDIEGAKGARRSLCRTCLDWSERRLHLAGSLGAALLDRIHQLGWARRERESRAIVFSAAGERSLHALFAPRRTSPVTIASDAGPGRS